MEGNESPPLTVDRATREFSQHITDTVAAPPPKKRKTDYLRLIACIPSDRLWKSWENKHLLRSYANGLSFAEIASTSQFSNGLVIRNEADCRARFEFLHQWQPSQDAELLRVGGGAHGVDENENFARTCSERFSKGLVKRSEKQCKERYEFLLVKGEVFFEISIIILKKGKLERKLTASTYVDGTN